MTSISPKEGSPRSVRKRFTSPAMQLSSVAPGWACHLSASSTMKVHSKEAGDGVIPYTPQVQCGQSSYPSQRTTIISKAGGRKGRPELPSVDYEALILPLAGNDGLLSARGPKSSNHTRLAARDVRGRASVTARAQNTFSKSFQTWCSE